MFGLGKKRTPLGEYLDKHGIPQQWLVDETELNKFTISKLCNDENHIPHGRTMKKVLNALRKKNANLKQEDFWHL